MIPEKIYLPLEEAKCTDSTLMVLPVRYEASDIEYTRTPTAKRFADEKPKEACALMCNNGDGTGWFYALFDGKRVRDVFDDEIIKTKYWCEIILPKELSDE